MPKMPRKKDKPLPFSVGPRAGQGSDAGPKRVGAGSGAGSSKKRTKGAGLRKMPKLPKGAKVPKSDTGKLKNVPLGTLKPKKAKAKSAKPLPTRTAAPKRATRTQRRTGGGRTGGGKTGPNARTRAVKKVAKQVSKRQEAAWVAAGGAVGPISKADRAKAREIINARKRKRRNQ